MQKQLSNRLRGRGAPAAVVVAMAAMTVATFAPAVAQGATYTFIPSASSTPTPAGTANWNDGGNWVNASGNTTGTIPGSADVVGSSTSATTVVDSTVPTVNDLRWANAAPGNTAATLGGNAIAATGDATLRIQAGGAVTILSTNGTANGGALFGRAQPSGGHLVITGGTLTTGSTVAISNDSPANVVIGDLANASGTSNSTFDISGGTANVGNNLIVGNQFNATAGSAKGTVTQTGGVVNVAGAVVLGANGSATYTISAGSLNQQGTQLDGAATGRDAFFVGRNANGTGNLGAAATFTQSGTASVKIANGLYIANNNNTTGTYTISGGTLAITGEIKVGASTNSANTVASTGNVGAFHIVGHAAATIVANQLTADTANSTLDFDVADAGGTSLLSLSAGGGFAGAAVLSSATKVDLDNTSGFLPTSGTFELLRATSINLLPTLVQDGDAFDSATLSIRSNGDGTQSLIAVVPEPATAAVAVSALAGLMPRRRRA